MNNEPNEDQLREIAEQLSRPIGESGIRTADQMHLNNIGMTRKTIKQLELMPGDKVLELGHGNGNHIPEIFNQQETIQYYGLEISELMSTEAAKYNNDIFKSGKASFLCYDGENIPFPSDYFTKIMTVNTLYFWKNPVSLFNEIYRVLKPGGKFNCTFAPKSFMEKLPFTKFVFELYDRIKVEKLIESSSFKTAIFNEYTEQITSREGQSIERNYFVVSLEK